jgi:hypothetical protein
MAVADDLNLGYTTRATVWSFESVQQATQEEAAVFLPRAWPFEI